MSRNEPHKRPTVIPGLILTTAIMLAGAVFADWLGVFVNQLQGLPREVASPISGIFTAIIIGLIIRNIFGLHPVFQPGVTFSVKFILKFGIVLLGIRLSFMDVVSLGAWGIPIILAAVITGLIITLWITTKMNQPHRLGTLIASGTGICGVTAIVAISPGIKANDEEVAYAVANITLFGLIAMFAYPHLAYMLFADDPVRTGLFLGTAIHETAQVAGASLIHYQMYGTDNVIEAATITKLTRNILIVAVVPILSYYYLKNMDRSSGAQSTGAPKWFKLIPLFVLGFLAMAVIRSVGDSTAESTGAAFGILAPPDWAAFTEAVSSFGSSYLLGIAMAAVGLSTGFGVFKGLGMKPFYIGLAAALSITAVSLLMVQLLGGFITL